MDGAAGRLAADGSGSGLTVPGPTLASGAGRSVPRRDRGKGQGGTGAERDRGGARHWQRGSAAEQGRGGTGYAASTSSSSSPRMTKPGFHSGSRTSLSPGISFSTVPNDTASSSLARGAPRQ